MREYRESAEILGCYRPDNEKIFHDQVWKKLDEFRSKLFHCEESQVQNWIKENRNLLHGVNSKAFQVPSKRQPNDEIQLSKIKEKRSNKENMVKLVAQQPKVCHDQFEEKIESAFDMMFDKDIATVESHQGVPALFVQEVLYQKYGLLPDMISGRLKASNSAYGLHLVSYN